VSYSLVTEQKRGIPLNGIDPMQVLSGSVATLAVATIYYVWRAYFSVQLRQQRLLHQRIAYLVWTLASQAD
jgi:hypothetical protein